MPQKTIRIPLSWEMNNRNSSGITTDARRVNVMDEPKTNGEDGVYTLKRPGLADTLSGFAAGTGQGLTFYGGATTAVISDNFVTDSQPASGATGTAWTANASAPWVGRYDGACVVLNGTIFIIGGKMASSVAADVWSTRDFVNWTQVTASAPWAGRTGFNCVVYNSTMYLFGGFAGSTNTTFNDVWSSPDGANWTLLTSGAPWSPRSSMASIVIGNTILMTGGAVNLTVFGDSWSTSDGINWTLVNSANTWGARYRHMMVNLNNQAFLFGGRVASGATTFNDAYSSPDGGITWVLANAAPFATARYDCGTFVYNNKMWCVGGHDNIVSNLTDVYSSPDAVTWTLVTNTPGWSARQGQFCCVAAVPNAFSPQVFNTMWMVGGSLTGTTYYNQVYRATLNTGISASVALSPAVANQSYQFNSFQEGAVLLIKNTTNMWVYNGGSIIEITDPAYPAVTVPGVVVIGGHAFVMDPTGLIYNCKLDDPFSWPSLNVVGADYEDDPGVAIAKYKNYLVAFGTYTIQFFYDTGISEGSPLLPYLAANVKIGCSSSVTSGAAAVASVGDTLVWVSQTREGLRQVMMLDGLQPVVISTPYIDKLLQYQGTWSVGATAYEGHNFFILNITPGDRSWVFDMQSKHWFEWESSFGRNGTSFDFGGYAYDTSSLAGYAKVLSLTTGKVFTVGEYYDDNGTPFTVLLQTQKVDGGNNRKKFWGQLEVIGDRSIAVPISDLPTSMPTLSFSDDDYQTWSTPRPVDMGTPRPVLYRNGSSRRRAIRYAQTDSQPMRLEALELTWEE